MIAARSFRELHLSRALRQRVGLYSEPREAAGHLEGSLRRWNGEWRRILADSPYYADLARREGLPAEFDSWETFLNRMPTTNRSLMKKIAEAVRSRSKPVSFYRVTGGTTAEPLQIPAWSSELAHSRLDLWTGRSWYGIRPSSRLFLLWGHSHLLGDGVSGRLNSWKRRLGDRLLGYYRFSAYNLDRQTLQLAAQRMLKFRPEYVLGYSVALDLFARANIDLAPALRELRLKAVIGAAECFPSPDSAKRLEDLFHAPAAMEYGSVETNLIAHTAPSGGYRAFWNSYFIEADEPRPGSRGRRVRVTSLYPRCVPLIRYELGDEIVLSEEEPASFGISRFTLVLGRCNDYVELGDGARIHSEAFTHAVRSFSEIAAYQVVQEDRGVKLRVVPSPALSPGAEGEIKRRLGIIHPALADTPVEQTPKLETTLAGKTPMIIRR